MKSKTARRQRRKRTQKVRNINKMKVCTNLAGAGKPARVFFVDNCSEVAAYICDATEILAIGVGSHEIEALKEAAIQLNKDFIRSVEDDLVGTINPMNPLHYTCPNCGAGLNEKCVSIRNGNELKNLHAERRRLATPMGE